MRTKTLVCAAILAAGLASSMAQSNVYSLNVVGYYNVVIPAGQKKLVANQLHTTNDVLTTILPGPYGDGTTFFYFNNGFSGANWDTDANEWDNNFNLPIGTGGFLFSQSLQTFTFVGEVQQGSLTNKLKKLSKVIAGSQVPIPVMLNDPSTAGLIGEDGDTIFAFNNGFSGANYDTDAGAWAQSLSTTVGSAWFIYKQGSQTNWVQNFTVQ